MEVEVVVVEEVVVAVDAQIATAEGNFTLPF